MSAAQGARERHAPRETEAGQYARDEAASVAAQLTAPVSNHAVAMAAGRESYPDGQGDE